MNYRLVSTILTAFFAFIGCGTIYVAKQMHHSDQAWGPAFFPITMAVLILAFCAVILIRNYRIQVENVELNYKKHVIATILGTVLFIVLWSVAHNLFYLWLFLYAMGLYIFYKGKETKNIKVFGIGFGLSTGLTLFIFIVFQKLVSLVF